MKLDIITRDAGPVTVVTIAGDLDIYSGGAAAGDRPPVLRVTLPSRLARFLVRAGARRG